MQNGSSRKAITWIFITTALFTPLGLSQAVVKSASPGVATESQSSSERTFDVVSIRPSRPNAPWLLGTSQDDYHALNLPLGRTVLRAYFPSAYQAGELVLSAPSWLWNDRYDFLAKVAPKDLPEWQSERQLQAPLGSFTLVQRMLQSALEERCGLKVHRAPVEMDGFALVVSKGGPSRKALKASQPGGVIPQGTLKISGGGQMLPIMPGSEPHLTFFRTDMASLAGELTKMLGSPVEDRTKLAGAYDFVVAKPTEVPPPAGTNSSAAPTSHDPIPFDVGPLGLKLVSVKLKVDGVVIDEIKRPFPN